MKSIFSQANEIGFDALFNLLPINFSWVDTRGYILGCNQRLLDCIGIEDIEDILGRHMKDFVSDTIWENTKKVIEQGNNKTFEETTENKNGTTTYFISTKSPVKSKDGKVLGVVIISIDITDRKLMEMELKKEKERAELADKTKTEFLSNIRHDLRTPFCGIIGAVELLQDMEKDETKKSFLKDIKESSESLLEHLNEILEYVKVETGEFPILEKEFDIHELVSDIYRMLVPLANNKKLNFTLNINKKVPSFLIGDPSRTQRILMNIVSNAIKFTENGNVCIDMSWTLKEKNTGVVEFYIEDNGIGIPENKKDAIFERFTRLTPSYIGTYNGSGLGLNIVKQFLSEIGGQYDINSIVGKGTVFKISIPYRIPLLSNISH
jgi:two-component system aerobic respiration control sensor histidine kinase ArcB